MKSTPAHMRPRDIIERIYDKIHREPYSGCWFWEGVTYNGHPKIWSGNKPVYARTVLARHLSIPKPPNFSTKCGHNDCMNPSHWIPMRKPVLDRLKRASVKVGECIEVFPANKSEKHRVIRDNSWRQRGAHVIAYEAANGPVPDGLIVRHKCDNPKCVNPEHLEVGTYKDNSQDAVVRGRIARGERVHLSKLTEAQAIGVVRLFESGVAITDVAKAFGISYNHAWTVAKKHTWRHLWR